MGLFGKKKKGTPPPCCGRTPETAVRVGADKTAASVKVLGSGCARCSALEAAVRAALAELGVTTPALVVGGRVVSCGRVPGQAELREMLREALEKETLEQGPAV